MRHYYYYYVSVANDILLMAYVNIVIMQNAIIVTIIRYDISGGLECVGHVLERQMAFPTSQVELNKLINCTTFAIHRSRL